MQFEQYGLESADSFCGFSHIALELDPFVSHRTALVGTVLRSLTVDVAAPSRPVSPLFVVFFCPLDLDQLQQLLSPAQEVVVAVRVT